MSKKITAISDMEYERYQNENRVFKISNMQIMLDLNSKPSEKKKDTDFTPFTYDMYFHPDFEKDAPETSSKLPFFTNEVQYPVLQSKSLKECVEFFFNVNKFTEEIRANGSNWVEPLDKDTDVDARNAQILENEKANISAMLRSLFPISGKFGNALASSYDNYILQNANWEIVYGVDPMELVNIFGFAERFGAINKDRNSSYIKINGKPKSIFSVTWENDIVNHPVYKKFIETYINQVKRTHMKKYEVYSGLNAKNEAIDTKLRESWASYSVKDQVYNNPKHMKRLCKLLGISDKDGIYKIEKQLNRINFDELLNKWNTDIELVKLRFRQKIKEATTATKVVNVFKSPKQTGGETADMTPKEIVTALKNTNTIGSLIHYLEGQSASSNDYDEYDRRSSGSSSKQRDTITRITYKLTSLNSENGAKGLGAANIFSEVNDMIVENNISLGEYSKMFKEYLNLAVEVEAANSVYLFVSENKPIRIAKNGVFLDGTKETETNKLVDRKMRELYGPIMKESEELANSVENVYTPKRKTSNVQLFELIELIKGKNKKGKENIDKSKSHVFEKIYRKYFAKRTMNYPLSELKQYMYTGVDTTIKPPQSREEQSDEKKKTEDPGISEEFSEIYVRMNVIDKEHYDKGAKSQCKLKEDILKNELHYLLDIESMAYLNPFRDYGLLEEYIESAKKDKKEDEPLPNKENKIPPNKEKNGGKSRRIRPKRLRKTRR